MPDLSNARHLIRDHYFAPEQKTINSLIDYLDLSAVARQETVDEAADFVRALRLRAKPGMMEAFLGEYGLSTEEGVALMCLAEALLRVPDEGTIDVLIRDKIAPANWSSHLGRAASPLVNASTWALMLTGAVVSPGEVASWDVVANIRRLIRRAGEPVIRKAVAQAMKVLGHQFVLGSDIGSALSRATGMEEKGYRYSYDMLGEAACTADDASRYFLAYSKAISALSEAAIHEDIKDNPGISVKLSALHPRYEYTQDRRVMTELVPRVTALALQAKNANIAFTIDAEEADRLDLSLDVIEAVLSVADLAGWAGFGVVVQAYGPRSFYVLDWCHALAQQLDRQIMIRLVKGAYWDSEIKRAQVEGFSGYPVFTRKSATDISYMACARKLLSMTDHVYPQFATHNAHTVMSVLAMANDRSAFEFQRLHGMGEVLHDLAKESYGTRCRIYAPVGVHEDLLAYLVRRLLENGANSSFVNQLFDDKVPAKDVVRDPVAFWLAGQGKKQTGVQLPKDIYPDGRVNSAGIEFANPVYLHEFEQERREFLNCQWGNTRSTPDVVAVINPADGEDHLGGYVAVSRSDIDRKFGAAKAAQQNWADLLADDRGNILDRIADLYENHGSELMALMMREAGKTPADALAELREAVDFCRYYAQQARLLTPADGRACGVLVCISPWNFPLAIFTGQIVAALVCGNGVMAKPAPQTPLVAELAVKLMTEAGIPEDVLQLCPGGAEVGQMLVSLPDIEGVCFTGSTQAAQKIHRSMAQTAACDAPLIAETGGLNAMIVDTTALPEQAVRDIVASAFQSAGQRCSALRLLYVQEEVAPRITEMLMGAMEELSIGNPWQFSTDVGPVIDAAAHQTISGYIDEMKAKGAVLKQCDLSDEISGRGFFIPPALIQVSGIAELSHEIFGPVLHVATYKSGDVEAVVDQINGAGYGLTLGLHTRVNSRVQAVAERAKVGNIYVNRNQIGAVVGVQPFGGEGLSGTGPKAGGPLYLHKFLQANPAIPVQLDVVDNLQTGLQELTEIDMPRLRQAQDTWMKCPDRVGRILAMLEELSQEDSAICEIFKARMAGYSPQAVECAGPTGESNQLSYHGRGVIWIAGAASDLDCLVALATGNAVIFGGGSVLGHLLVTHSDFKHLVAQVAPSVTDEEIARLPDISACCLSFDDQKRKREARQLLSARKGTIISILGSHKSWREFVHERCLSIDITASGGNTELLASATG